MIGVDHAAATGTRPAGPGSDAVAELARSWTRVVARSTFIPGPRVRARTTLDGLLRRLVTALAAEPFDARAGYHAGADLVAARMSTPAVLGESLTLLGNHLPGVAGTVGDQAAGRMALLLGQFAAGFTEALRGVAVGAAEEINRAERAAWRQQQLSLQRRLQYALLHDPLTGLPNRSQFLDSLTARIADAEPGERLGICLLSLERFAVVNDALGHHTGERLLRQVAYHLRPVAAGQGYLVAHLGTDEFVLVIPDTAGAEDVVKAVDRFLRTPDLFTVDGRRLPVTARAGIVECPVAGADPIDLLRSAHIALGWAMADRGAAYAIFDPARCAADIHRHNLAVRMSAALRAGEFTLDYQPLVRFADGAVVGAEALVRWRHPDLGTLGPDQFIPLAEQTGLIGALGLHVLERACVQASSWGCRRVPASGADGWSVPPFVSVNLAPAQLAEPGLIAAVSAVLDKAALDADRLQLEITESAAVDAHHHGMLGRLADVGVRLAIDDFGTGYSSLAYLTELPIHTVKLAARFVSGGPTGRPATILPNIIAMCHDLGISVTAEGVETPAQAAELTALRCDTGQGYFLARPMPPERVSALFS